SASASRSTRRCTASVLTPARRETSCSRARAMPRWRRPIATRRRGCARSSRVRSPRSRRSGLHRWRRCSRSWSAIAGRGPWRGGRLVAVAGPALVVGAAAVALALRGRGDVDPCTGGVARHDRSWSAAIADEVRGRLGSAGWATTATAALDATATQWQASFRNVCEATRVRGEQSDALLELRMRCLARALDRFDALVAALRVDTGVRVEASAAIAELPPPAACETLVDPPD